MATERKSSKDTDKGKASAGSLGKHKSDKSKDVDKGTGVASTSKGNSQDSLSEVLAALRDMKKSQDEHNGKLSDLANRMSSVEQGYYPEGYE